MGSKKPNGETVKISAPKNAEKLEEKKSDGGTKRIRFMSWYYCPEGAFPPGAEWDFPAAVAESLISALVAEAV